MIFTEFTKTLERLMNTRFIEGMSYPDIDAITSEPIDEEYENVKTGDMLSNPYI